MMDSAKSTEKRLRAQQAKEFLISQIVEEARRENVSLSEVERKMLYFTETEKTLPNIYEINDQFEREYDASEYEKKIAGLLRIAYRRICHDSPDGKMRWRRAVAHLKGDHYLRVMVNQASEPDVVWWMPILWGMGISVVVFILIVIEVSLDQRGLIPGWVFGWISDDPSTRQLQFYLILGGAVGLWVVIKFAKEGVLGEISKTLFSGILSTFSFLRPKGRFRR